MITFDNVHVDSGRRRLMGPVTFRVSRGETVVLLGRSGSGKTTTLRLINALLEPTGGEVRVGGRATTAWDSVRLRRSIGYVIQEVGLFPHFTVRRNVGVVPVLEGWDAGRREGRVVELLDLVGLPAAEYGGRFPHELSGGERQRVGVARALAADPPILLCDEPFGALDPVTRTQLQEEFATLKARLGKTVLFVTHDVREALLLGDRVILLHEGRIRFDGSPEAFRTSDDESVGAFRSML